MKRLIILTTALLAMACTDREPIEIEAPQRTIHTEALKQYKANLDKRNITMGMLYNWTNEGGSFLMKTPDSLDVVVIKDNYNDLSETQKKDLTEAQQKKATKVFVGLNFEAQLKTYEAEKETKVTAAKELKQKELDADPNLIDEQKKEALKKVEEDVIASLATATIETLQKHTNEVLQIAKNNGFDGISIEFTDEVDTPFSSATFSKLLASVIAAKGNLLLLVENPYSSTDAAVAKPLSSANWIVYHKKNNELLKSFTEQAANFPNNRYLPSTDFTEETLADGFSDSKRFSPDGKNGRYSRLDDILYWTASNRGGIALYHIEKDYYNLSGKSTFKNLRALIHQLQQQK